MKRKKRVKARLEEAQKNHAEWTKRKDRFNAVYYRGYLEALEWVLN